MKKSLLRLTTLALVCLVVPSSRSAEPTPETPAERDARLAWWREARFGMFVHWGPVSLKGTEISWSRANTNPAHPNKGPIPADVYDKLYKEFNPGRFDARRWAAIARSAGMKYVILTAKHCDSFCLWDSPTCEYKITRTPFRRDVCAELAAAVREESLRIGWYYSPMDWRDPDCRTDRNAAYVARMQDHLRELLSGYGRIDLLWFDTDGCPAPWDQARTYDLVRGLQPRIVINNRLDLGSMADYEAMPIAPQADYYTPEQRVGKYDDRRPWEACMTLGTQWSWKPDDRIKTVPECVRILARCAGGDGNLLLNVGPMPTGEIEPRQLAVLEGIGKWLERHGESIYGTRGGPYLPTDEVVSTRKGNAVYLHVLSPDVRTVELPALPATIAASEGPGGGKAEARQGGGRLTIMLCDGAREDGDTVIRLTLDRPATSIPLIRVDPRGVARPGRNEE